MKIEIGKEFPQYFKPSYPEEFELFHHFEVTVGIPTVLFAVTTCIPRSKALRMLESPMYVSIHGAVSMGIRRRFLLLWEICISIRTPIKIYRGRNALALIFFP